MAGEAGCALRHGCTNLRCEEPAPECLVCPYEYPCRCGAGIGQRCKRPSGHRCDIHIYRVEISDKIALTRHRGHLDVTYDPAENAEWDRKLAHVRIPYTGRLW